MPVVPSPTCDSQKRHQALPTVPSREREHKIIPCWEPLEWTNQGAAHAPPTIQKTACCWNDSIFPLLLPLPSSFPPSIPWAQGSGFCLRTLVRGQGNQPSWYKLANQKFFFGFFTLMGYWLLDSSLHLLRLGFFICKMRTNTKPLPVLNQHSVWHSFLSTGFYKEKEGRRIMILDPWEGETEQIASEWEC